MTSPGGEWAKAKVKAELDWSNLSGEMRAKLIRETAIAERAVRANFARMEKGAKQSFDRMASKYDATMQRMTRRTNASVSVIERRFDRLDGRGIDVKINVDTRDALRQTQATHAAMQGWLNTHPLNARIQVEADRINDRVASRIGQSAAATAQRAMSGRNAPRMTVEVDTDAVQRAERSLAGARRAAEIATSKQEDAERRLSAVRNDSSSTAEQIRKAELAAASARHSAANATDRVTDSEVRLNKSRRGRDVKVEKDTNRTLMSRVGILGDIAGTTAKISAISTVAGLGIAGVGAAVGGLVGAVGVAGGAVGALGGGMAALGPAAMTGIAVATVAFGGLKDAAKEFNKQFEEENAAVLTRIGQMMGPLLTQWNTTSNALKMGLAEAIGPEAFSQMGSILKDITPQLTGIVSSIGGQIFDITEMIRDDGMNELTASLGGVRSLIDGMGPGIQNLIMGFLNMGQAAAPAMLAIGNSLGGIATAIGESLGNLDTSFFTQFAGLMSSVGSTLGTILPAIFGLAQTIMPSLGTFLTQFGNAIAQIAPGLGTIANALLGALGGPVLDGLVTLINALSTALAPALGPVGELINVLGTALAGIAPTFGQLVTVLAQSLMPILPILGQAITTIGNALIEALPIAAPVITQIVQLFADLLAAVAPLVPPFLQLLAAILTPLVGVLQTLVTALTPVIEQFAAGLQPIIAQITPILQQLGEVLGQAIVEAIQILMPYLPQMIEAWSQMVIQMTEFLPILLQLAVMALPLVMDALKVLVPIFVEVYTQVNGAIATFMGFIQTLMNVGLKIAEFVKNAGDKMSGLRDTIVNAVKGAGKWLLDTGKNLVQGMIDGIKSMMGALGNAIVDLLPGPIKGIARRALGLAEGGEVAAMATGGQAGRSGRQRTILALRSGGKIHGPGGPKSDIIPALLSAGEFVVPAKAVNAQTLPMLEAMRSGRGVPAYATGGVALRDAARNVTGSGYVWGGWGNGWNTDCSGVVSSLVNMATGKANGPGEGERSATGGFADWLSKMGLQPGLGPTGSLQVGWSDTHAAATLPTGENVEHTGPEGTPGKFGSDAEGASEFPNQMHLPMGDPSLGGMSGAGGASLGGGAAGGFGSGSTSYGNAGGSSSFSSASAAEAGGVTPVWVENWPSNLGAGGTSLGANQPGSVDLGGAAAAPASNVDTIALVQNPDGTYSAKDPEWQKLITRESGGRPDVVQGIQDVNSGGNEASGLFQIAKGTWANYGGTKFAPTAGEATPEQQAEIAAKIFNAEGGSPWGSGAGQNFGREDESKLRAGIQRKGTGAVPAPAPAPMPNTPSGNAGLAAPSLGADTNTAEVGEKSDAVKLAEQKLAEAQNRVIDGKTAKARANQQAAKDRAIATAQRNLDSANRDLTTARSGASLTPAGEDATAEQKAQAALDKKRLAEQKAIDNVADAEAKLTQVRSDPRSKPSDITAAENALTRARNNAQEAADGTREAEGKITEARAKDAKKAAKEAREAREQRERGERPLTDEQKKEQDLRMAQLRRWGGEGGQEIVPEDSDNPPAWDSMPYGVDRANAYIRDQDWGKAGQDLALSAATETFGGFLEPFGLQKLFETGMDKLGKYLDYNRVTPAEIKYADTVNNYGMDPNKVKQKATEGMTAATETYRQG